MAVETIIVITAMILILLIAIVIPFLTKNAKHIEIDNTLNFERGKEEIFVLLSDLEYDYQMGKIAVTDYQQIKAELTEKAAVFMNNSLTSIDPIEKEVDEEINKYLSIAVCRERRANGG